VRCLLHISRTSCGSDPSNERCRIPRPQPCKASPMERRCATIGCHWVTTKRSLALDLEVVRSCHMEQLRASTTVGPSDNDVAEHPDTIWNGVIVRRLEHRTHINCQASILLVVSTPSAFTPIQTTSLPTKHTRQHYKNVWTHGQGQGLPQRQQGRTGFRRQAGHKPFVFTNCSISLSISN
jgi:hypothetical protein